MLGIKWYSTGTPRPFKNLSNSARCNCQNIRSWSRWPKTILKIRERLHFSRWSTSLLFSIFFRDFRIHRKKINRMVVFRHVWNSRLAALQSHYWKIIKTRYLTNQGWLWPSPTSQIQEYYVFWDRFLKIKQVKRYLSHQDWSFENSFMQIILP